jgi:hypothetical protein
MAFKWNAPLARTDITAAVQNQVSAHIRGIIPAAGHEEGTATRPIAFCT